MINYVKNVNFHRQLHEPDNKELLMAYKYLPSNIHFYICTGYTDLRKSIDGLSSIVESFGLNPFSSSLFFFCGKRADRLKALSYDGDRFICAVQRLEDKTLQWPRLKGEPAQMWMLDRAAFFDLLLGKTISAETALYVIKHP